MDPNNFDNLNKQFWKVIQDECMGNTDEEPLMMSMLKKEQQSGSSTRRRRKKIDQSCEEGHI
jgi:hypothetical protein